MEAHHPPPRRDFHQQKQYLQESVSYSRYASLPVCLSAVLEPNFLKAATGVSSSYDALSELFECFEHYLGRLKVLTEFPSAVREILVKIMVELLEVLALATQQIKQGRFSGFSLVDTSQPFLS